MAEEAPFDLGDSDDSTLSREDREKRASRIERSKVEGWKLIADFSKWLSGFSLAAMAAATSIGAGKGAPGMSFYVVLVSMLIASVLGGLTLLVASLNVQVAIDPHRAKGKEPYRGSHLVLAQIVLFLVGIVAFAVFAASSVHVVTHQEHHRASRLAGTRSDRAPATIIAVVRTFWLGGYSSLCASRNL